MDDPTDETYPSGNWDHVDQSVKEKLFEFVRAADSCGRLKSGSTSLYWHLLGIVGSHTKSDAPESKKSLWILPEVKPNNSVEIRLTSDGELDEVVLADSEGSCLFHMECMDREEGHWWMRFYSTNRHPLPTELVVNLGPGSADYTMECQ